MRARIPAMNVTKVLIAAGFVPVAIGLCWMGLSRLGVNLGRLPGDMNYGNDRVSFSFPIVTCLLLSAVLTLAGWVLARMRGP